MGGSKPPSTVLNFGLIQFSRNEASQLPQSVYFVTTKGSLEQFQVEVLFYKCFTLVFTRFSVAVAATVYQEHHFWTRLRTEGQELCAFLFLTQFFLFLCQSTATHDLNQHKKLKS